MCRRKRPPGRPMPNWQTPQFPRRLSAGLIRIGSHHALVHVLAEDEAAGLDMRHVVLGGGKHTGPLNAVAPQLGQRIWPLVDLLVLLLWSLLAGGLGHRGRGLVSSSSSSFASRRKGLLIRAPSSDLSLPLAAASDVEVVLVDPLLLASTAGRSTAPPKREAFRVKPPRKQLVSTDASVRRKKQDSGYSSREVGREPQRAALGACRESTKP